MKVSQKNLIAISMYDVAMKDMRITSNQTKQYPYVSSSVIFNVISTSDFIFCQWSVSYHQPGTFYATWLMCCFHVLFCMPTCDHVHWCQIGNSRRTVRAVFGARPPASPLNSLLPLSSFLLCIKWVSPFVHQYGDCLSWSHTFVKHISLFRIGWMQETPMQWQNRYPETGPFLSLSDEGFFKCISLKHKRWKET